MNIHPSNPLKLVFDTNVALDWIVFEDPVVAPLRDAVALKRVVIVSDRHALEELREVMGREKFGIAPSRQLQLLEHYRANTLAMCETAGPLPDRSKLPAGFPRCRDPDDDPFLALAYRSGANLLVSRDKAVLALRRQCLGFGFRVVTRETAIAAIGCPSPSGAI